MQKAIPRVRSLPTIAYTNSALIDSRLTRPPIGVPIAAFSRPGKNVEMHYVTLQCHADAKGIEVWKRV